jgi:hypothetical protein
MYYQSLDGAQPLYEYSISVELPKSRVLTYQRQQLEKLAAIIRKGLLGTCWESPKFFEKHNQLTKVLK